MRLVLFFFFSLFAKEEIEQESREAEVWSGVRGLVSRWGWRRNWVKNGQL